MAPEPLILYEVQTRESDIWAAAATIVEVFSREKVWLINCFDQKNSVTKQLINFIRTEKVPRNINLVPDLIF